MTYRLEIKIKNGVLFALMEAAGIFTQSELARAVGLTPQQILPYANLTVSPLNENGDPRSVALKLAEFFGVSPEDLCPPEIVFAPLANGNKRHIDLSSDQMAALMSPEPEDALKLLTDQRDEEKVLALLVAALTARETLVVHERYDGGTYEAIALKQGVTRERIRQIEHKAMRKMKARAASLGLDRVAIFGG